jgi:hypothetical protein
MGIECGGDFGLGVVDTGKAGPELAPVSLANAEIRRLDNFKDTELSLQHEPSQRPVPASVDIKTATIPNRPSESNHAL